MSWPRAIVAVFSILSAACAGVASTNPAKPSGSVDRPYALQSNAPSPTPWQLEPRVTSIPVLGPDGSSIWQPSEGSYGHVYRLDIPTNTVLDVSVSGVSNHGHAGPDGNLWFCGQNQIGKISATGTVTYYPEPISNCFGITLGSDGNMWLTDQYSVDRVTLTGQLTTYRVPAQVLGLGDIVSSSKNGLIWFEFETKTQFGLGTLNPATSQFHLWPYSSCAGGGGLSSGIDGDAYEVPSGCRSTTEVIRISPSGVITRFPNLPRMTGYYNNSEDAYKIWLGSTTQHLFAWSVLTHQLTDEGNAPVDTNYPILGPDMNVWFQGGVFLQRIITVTPSSATLAQGQSQVFGILETGCSTCDWSAKSSDSKIATVGSIRNGQFEVTGRASGQASVSVSDGKHNVVLIPIAVN